MDNTLLFLLISILFIISFLIAIHICNKRNNTIRQLELDKQKLETLKVEELQDYFRKKWESEEQQLKDKLKIKTDGLEKEWQGAFQKHHIQLSTLDNEIQKYETILAEKEKRYNEVNQDLDLYRQGKITEIDDAAQEYKKRQQLLITQSIDTYRNRQMSMANIQLEMMQSEKEDAQKEIEEIKASLEEERSKRAAVNEEIRRQRQVEEQQDFYRIQLDPNDTNDVEILRSIAPRLLHPEAINKVIWSGYYQKPLAELRKRVAVESSGIYKITRIKTNEIYIGQAVNVSTRWADHVKTALGVGTLASSQLHRVMAIDGPENFTFELLEEVPKDKLKERESYYIDFYDSKNYGLNTIRGEQK